jgi:hypothetical protein
VNINILNTQFSANPVVYASITLHRRCDDIPLVTRHVEIVILALAKRVQEISFSEEKAKDIQTKNDEYGEDCDNLNLYVSSKAFFFLFVPSAHNILLLKY